MDANATSQMATYFDAGRVRLLSSTQHRQVNQAVLAVDETRSGFATYVQPRTILELVGLAKR